MGVTAHGDETPQTRLATSALSRCQLSKLMGAKSGQCIHFNGVQNKVCKAGVEYTPGNLPCIKQYAKGAVCVKYQEPTVEQVAERETQIKASIERMGKVYAAIKPIRKEQKGKNWRGVVECPICKGRLHLSHAAYNGHMHGKCETEGCVAWME